MQPQDVNIFDWPHIIAGLIGSLFGGISGLFVGVWRMARFEPELRKEITQEIAEATNELHEKIDNEVGHFGETLHGLREKINGVELLITRELREFVSKEDFNSYREELRDDMRELKKNVSAILGTMH
jgi:gas vesicle protein